MRDTKSTLLLLVSLLLVLVSFVFIWTLAHNYYTNNKAEKPTLATYVPDSAVIARRVKDSLQKLYAETFQDFDTKLDSTIYQADSLQKEFNSKLETFYRLRAEIATILKNFNEKNNFTVARQKIGELQNSMEDLQSKNRVVDSENKKLKEVLAVYGKAENIPATASAGTIKTNAVDKKTGNPVFAISDLKLTALMDVDDTYLETNLAEKTEKLSGSFTVLSNHIQQENAEMIIVVVKPDGKVFSGSGWDMGTFITPAGKKVYSYKINFTYTRGEARQLSFSLKSGNLSRGNYTLEIYQHGQMIGKITKLLS